MPHTGLIDYYWDRIWEIWNERDNPEALAKILDYLDKIAVHSQDPATVEETERTKRLLQNEANTLRKAAPNLHPSILSKTDTKSLGGVPKERKGQGNVELEEDLPIRIEDLVLIERPNISFNEIGGLQNVKEQLKMETIYPRLFPEKYGLYGRTPGNGILLWGAPGCGKTMLAKAIAKESGETVFISPKVSDIMNRWVGESEKIIAAIFDYARKFPRATLFLDEIDYVAPRSGPSYMMRIKRELLQQMDGITSKKEGLLVFGATNRPWVLDPAIRRPSPDGLRFSKIVLVPPPDLEARKVIFEITLRRTPKEMIADNVNLSELAEMTNGFSGADIGAICEEAVDIPLNEYIKGSTPRAVDMNDFRRILQNKPKSIIPWIVDALKSAKRQGEEHLAAQTMELAKEYLEADELSFLKED